VRIPRNVSPLRILDSLGPVLVGGTVALLAKPEWREYFLEVGSVLALLLMVRVSARGMRARFLAVRTSPFERALHREVSFQKSPSQLLSAIGMAAVPEKSTFDLLAEATDRRLQDRHGIGLDDPKAADVLGSEVFALLTATRRSGPTWALRNRSPRWIRDLRSLMSKVLDRRAFKRQSNTELQPSSDSRDSRNSRNSRNTAQSVAVEQVRTILTRLEQL
jgi:hypothetical protein